MCHCYIDIFKFFKKVFSNETSFLSLKYIGLIKLVLLFTVKMKQDATSGRIRQSNRNTDMASKLNEREEHCECERGCQTSATITEWSCGCVSVEVHRDSNPCHDCTDFSGMRVHCGAPGEPS